MTDNEKAVEDAKICAWGYCGHEKQPECWAIVRDALYRLTASPDSGKSDHLRQALALLRMVTIREMGGTPDLFWPGGRAGGWDWFDERVEALLRTTASPNPEKPCCGERMNLHECVLPQNHEGGYEAHETIICYWPRPAIPGEGGHHGG